MTAPTINSNTPQSHTEPLTLHCGNNVDVLRSYPDCHFDAIITDPPYGIEFLGKAWDNHTGAIETWRECLRVLKPGGHLLAFSAARTYHNLATNIESTGFEIRDQLMWIYSSGFPKAQDMGKAIQKRQGVKKSIQREMKEQGGFDNWVDTQENKNAKRINQTIIETVCTSPEALQWAGWKTALKPGHEPIVMARKPMKGSTIDNVIQHGVGALNIDSSRIPYEDQQDLNTYINNIAGPLERSTASAGDTIQMHEGRTGFKVQRGVVKRPTGGADGLSRLEFGEREPVKYKDQKRVIRAGRDPRNRLKDLETQTTPADHNHEETPVYEANPQGRYPSNVLGDIPDYQKYFYCPKVSRRERHVGFDKQYTTGDAMRELGGNWTQMETASGIKSVMTRADGSIMPLNEVQVIVEQKNIGNNHPTVKPVALMRYLIQLVTPAGSTVLDPFMGSGSTGMAASELGHRFVGIDLDPAYVEIAQKRIEGWVKTETTRSVQPETATDLKHTDLFDDLFE